MVDYDTWLLELEWAKAELSEDPSLKNGWYRGEKWFEMNDFFSEWIFQIRLYRSLNVIF